MGGRLTRKYLILHETELQMAYSGPQHDNRAPSIEEVSAIKQI